jgi:hypothetical protein
VKPTRYAAVVAVLAAAAAAVPAALAATASQSGSAVTEVSLVSGGNATQGSPLKWTALPGASTTVTVPAGHTGIVDARFAGEQLCFGAAGTCKLRILVDGKLPPTGAAVTFSSTDNGVRASDSWQSGETETTSAVLKTGKHTVTVQYEVDNAAASFRLDDWVLAAERIQVS